MTNLSKKITMLMDVQRSRFNDFEDTMTKLNVRVDALTKRQNTVMRSNSRALLAKKANGGQSLTSLNNTKVMTKIPS